MVVLLLRFCISMYHSSHTCNRIYNGTRKTSHFFLCVCTIALGTLNPQTQSQFLSRELRMAFVLSLILSLAGFLRAMLFQTPLPETLAVTMALSMIVFSSICLGAVLPLVLQKVGVDPAHSSTTIQVVMDILGGEW